MAQSDQQELELKKKKVVTYLNLIRLVNQQKCSPLEFQNVS